MTKLIVFIGILALAALGLLSWSASLSNNAVEIAQAQAAIEAARAAQDAAQAAQIAARGLSAVSVINSLILLVLLAICLALVVLLGYYVITHRPKPQPRWAPGPNANFRHVSQPRLPQGTPTAQDILNAIIYQQVAGGKQIQLSQLQPPEEPGESEIEW
jgi:hypothetical protein